MKFNGIDMCDKHTCSAATNALSRGKERFLLCGDCAMKALESGETLIRLSDGREVKLEQDRDPDTGEWREF